MKIVLNAFYNVKVVVVLSMSASDFQILYFVTAAVGFYELRF